MGIQTVVAVGFLGFCSGLFVLKDWEIVELDWETKKLTIKRRSNSLPPAN